LSDPRPSLDEAVTSPHIPFQQPPRWSGEMRLNNLILPLACLQTATALQLDIDNTGKSNKIRGLPSLTISRFHKISVLENR
jgi:hypothetical protein